MRIAGEEAKVNPIGVGSEAKQCENADADGQQLPAFDAPSDKQHQDEDRQCNQDDDIVGAFSHRARHGSICASTNTVPCTSR